MADKSFITPSALGLFFNEIHNITFGELQNSKAKLVNEIKTQLEANYGKQVEKLDTTISSLEKANQRDLNVYQKQLEEAKDAKLSYDQKFLDMEQKLKRSQHLRLYFFILLVVAIIVGYVLGKVFGLSNVCTKQLQSPEGPF